MPSFRHGSEPGNSPVAADLQVCRARTGRPGGPPPQDCYPGSWKIEPCLHFGMVQNRVTVLWRRTSRSAGPEPADLEVRRHRTVTRDPGKLNHAFLSPLLGVSPVLVGHLRTRPDTRRYFSFHPTDDTTIRYQSQQTISRLDLNRATDDNLVHILASYTISSRQHVQGAERFQTSGLSLHMLLPP